MEYKNTIKLPNEIIYLVAEQIHDKRTFYRFSMCFPNIARLLKNKKQKEFADPFFKCVYHPFENLFGMSKGVFGSRTNFQLPKKSDLINQLYLNIELPSELPSNYLNYTNNIGNRLVKDVRLQDM